jgi:hypothetical protein
MKFLDGGKLRKTFPPDFFEVLYSPPDYSLNFHTSEFLLFIV